MEENSKSATVEGISKPFEFLTIETIDFKTGILLAACEEEVSRFGEQIKIGTVIPEPKIFLEVTFRGYKPIKVRSLEHALYQARMWREYAQTFNGWKHPRGVTHGWVFDTLHMGRRDCLAYARVWVIAAGMWNKERPR